MAGMNGVFPTGLIILFTTWQCFSMQSISRNANRGGVMARNIVLVAIMAMLLLFCASCASIVSSNESTTYIETFPDKAECELHGQDFSRIVSTPNSIHLPAKSAPITIACKKEGYFTTSQALDTSMDGWIWGNLIFGGIIGGVVDLARGAGQKFPPKFSMILDPMTFNSNAERNEYYDKRAKAINDKWDEIIKKIEAGCIKKDDENKMPSTGQNIDCIKKMEEAEKKRHEELAVIEKRRDDAIIASK